MTRFRLERREQTPVLVQILVPIAAMLVALVLCSGLVRLAGTGILDAYGLLFLSTFQTATTSRTRWSKRRRSSSPGSRSPSPSAPSSGTSAPKAS